MHCVNALVRTHAHIRWLQKKKTVCATDYFDMSNLKLNALGHNNISVRVLSVLPCLELCTFLFRLCRLKKTEFHSFIYCLSQHPRRHKCMFTPILCRIYEIVFLCMHNNPPREYAYCVRPVRAKLLLRVKRETRFATYRFHTPLHHAAWLEYTRFVNQSPKPATI